MSWEKCGHRPGAWFAFHYGKKLSARVTGMEPLGTTPASGYRRTTTTSYSVSGRTSVPMCKPCIRRVRLRNVLLRTAGSLAAAFVAIGAAAGGGNGAAIVLFAGFGSLSLLAYALYAPFASDESVAKQVQEAKIKKEKKEGGFYDIVWTPKEYAKLQR
jgi:hypothetical protein